MATRWMRWNDTAHIFEYSTDGVTFNPLPLDASILTQGTVDPARLPAGGGGASLTADNVWTGVNQYSAAVPAIQFNETDQGANLKNWDVGAEGGLFRVRTLNDTLGGAATLFSLDRNGNLIVTPTGAGAHSLSNNFNGANGLQLANLSAGVSAYSELFFRNNLGDNRGNIRFTSSGWTAGAAFQPDALNVYGAGAGGVNLNTNTGPLTFQTANTTRLSIANAGLVKVVAGLEIGANLAQTGVITPPNITADQNDYNPTGLATASVLRLVLTANRTITGIAAQPAGTMLILQNLSNFTLTLSHLNTSSAAANRIVGPGQVDIVISSVGIVVLWYDIANGWWRVISEAGAAGAGTVQVAVKAVNGAGQALAVTTQTTLTMTGVDFSYGGTFWAAGAPSRLTIPAGMGGAYVIYGTAYPSVASNIRLRVHKNGAVAATDIRATAGGVQPSIGVTTMLQLAAGDYVELSCFVGTACTIGGSTRDVMTEFGLTKVA